LSGYDRKRIEDRIEESTHTYTLKKEIKDEEEEKEENRLLS